MEQNVNQAPLAFINKSPTAWHAVENLSARLDGAGFRELSEGERWAGVPVQRDSNRADIPGGSTIGHISLTHVSVCSLDAGLAQLAMHSCYETAGARDTVYLIKAARQFYSSTLRSSAGGYTIAVQRRP